MEQIGIDHSDIFPEVIPENSILQLIFPEQGFVHLRVFNSEITPYRYTNLTTIQPGQSDVSTAQRLGIPQFNLTNAIEVNYDLHLYQLFYSVSPGIIRARTGYPLETLTKGIDVRQNTVTGDFGFIDGLISPVTKPSRISETLIPPNLDVGYVFENPDTVPIKPQLHWIIVTHRVGVINDANLIYNIMAGKLDSIRNGKYVQRKTMGGISTYRYYPVEYYGVNYIDYDTMDSIDIAESTGDEILKKDIIENIKKAIGQKTSKKGADVPGGR